MVVFACVAAMFFVAACGGSDDDGGATTDSAATTEETVTEAEEPEGGDPVAIILTNPEASSFGQTAVVAAEQIESELGNEVTIQGGVTSATEQQVMEGYASRGTGLVIVHGAEMQQGAEQVAAQYPDTTFVVINGFAAAEPNLSSATYVWEEVGFLAGVAAGIATESNNVGQISSLEIPPILGIYEGFKQGVAQVNPKAKPVNSFTGSNTDPGKAATATSVQAGQGVDTVFTVATGADPGVFSTAQQRNLKVIGYGIDESNLGEDVILTSALVDYSGTIFEMAKMYNEGTLESKVYSYGFKENAFSLAPITNVDQAVADEIEKVAEQAINGEFEIKVAEAG